MELASFVPEWDSRLSVGDGYIDAQHAMLFRFIAQLKRALASNDGRDRLPMILDELKKYATFHFASEENHMADIGYPDRHAHGRVHTQMLDELAVHIHNVEIDPSSGHAALRFVEEWLNRHVAREDQMFAKYEAGKLGPGA